MAMVMSTKSKMCICSLIMLILIGIALSVVSTMGFFTIKREYHQVGTAEKYSQAKTVPQIVDRVSNLDMWSYNHPLIARGGLWPVFDMCNP
jgi:hypothetical protein